jgi:hypothetical protein
MSSKVKDFIRDFFASGDTQESRRDEDQAALIIVTSKPGAPSDSSRRRSRGILKRKQPGDQDQVDLSQGDDDVDSNNEDDERSNESGPMQQNLQVEDT